MHARQRTMLLAAALAAAFVAIGLSACAPATPAATDAPPEIEMSFGVAAPEMEAPATEAPMEFAEPPDVDDAGESAPEDKSNNLVAALPQDRLIIKNGEIEVTVQNTDAAIDQVTQIAVDNGGYVLSSQAHLDAGIKNSIMTIAVQAQQFEVAMRRLRQIALEVRRENSTGEDVTSEFVDLESRLTNLEATADRIRSFLAQAKTVDEALKINKQLADVEAEIEQVKGRMTYLSGRAAFSTITVYLYQKFDATPTPTPTITPTPTPTQTPTPTPAWSLGPTVEKATYAQIGIVQGLMEIVTWVVVIIGPYLIAGGLVFYGIRKLSARFKPPTPPQPPSSTP